MAQEKIDFIEMLASPERRQKLYDKAYDMRDRILSFMKEQEDDDLIKALGSVLAAGEFTGELSKNQGHDVETLKRGIMIQQYGLEVAAKDGYRDAGKKRTSES